MIAISPTCFTCECLCEKINCNKECQGDHFQVFNNSDGCQTCNCTCPLVDCFTQCGDLYGIEHDDFGCDVCLCKKSRYWDKYLMKGLKFLCCFVIVSPFPLQRMSTLCKSLLQFLCLLACVSLHSLEEVFASQLSGLLQVYCWQGACVCNFRNHSLHSQNIICIFSERDIRFSVSFIRTQKVPRKVLWRQWQKILVLTLLLL